MQLSENSMAKMSEQNIHMEFARYLQRINLLLDGKQMLDLDSHKSVLMSFEEFKDFYILDLVGKNSFLDSLVYNYQKVTSAKA